MHVSPLQRQIQASDLPLEQLAGNSRLPEAEKIKEVSRQFEAILLRQILQTAYKPCVPSDMVSESAVTGIYQDLTIQQLADSISKSGKFGLALALQEQLTRQITAAEDSAAIETSSNSISND